MHKIRIACMIVFTLTIFANIASSGTFTMERVVWKVGEDFQDGYYKNSMLDYSAAMECVKVTETGILAEDANHAFVFLPYK